MPLIDSTARESGEAAGLRQAGDGTEQESLQTEPHGWHANSERESQKRAYQARHGKIAASVQWNRIIKSLDIYSHHRLMGTGWEPHIYHIKGSPDCHTVCKRKKVLKSLGYTCISVPVAGLKRTIRQPKQNIKQQQSMEQGLKRLSEGCDS